MRVWRSLSNARGYSGSFIAFALLALSSGCASGESVGGAADGAESQIEHGQTGSDSADAKIELSYTALDREIQITAERVILCEMESRVNSDGPANCGREPVDVGLALRSEDHERVMNLSTGGDGKVTVSLLHPELAKLPYRNPLVHVTCSGTSVPCERRPIELPAEVGAKVVLDRGLGDEMQAWLDHHPDHELTPKVERAVGKIRDRVHSLANAAKEAAEAGDFERAEEKMKACFQIELRETICEKARRLVGAEQVRHYATRAVTFAREGDFERAMETLESCHDAYESPESCDYAATIVYVARAEPRIDEGRYLEAFGILNECTLTYDYDEPCADRLKSIQPDAEGIRPDVMERLRVSRDGDDFVLSIAFSNHTGYVTPAGRLRIRFFRQVQSGGSVDLEEKVSPSEYQTVSTDEGPVPVYRTRISAVSIYSRPEVSRRELKRKFDASHHPGPQVSIHFDTPDSHSFERDANIPLDDL